MKTSQLKPVRLMWCWQGVPVTCLLGLVLGVTLCIGQIHAESPTHDLPDFHAKRVIESTPGPFISRVYFSEGKERAETLIGSGATLITIVRPDKQLVWLLDSQTKTYQQVSFDDRSPSAIFPSLDGLKLNKEEWEILGGVRTMRYRVTDDHGQNAGYVWFSEQGLPIRQEEPTGSPQAGGSRVTMFEDLHFGAQPPTLFELPSGYKKQD